MGYHALFYSLQRLNSDDEVYEDVRNMVSLLLPSIKRTYLLASNELSPLWFGIFAGTANQYYDGDVTDDEVDRVNYSLQHQAIDMIDWVISNYQRMDISMQPFVVRGGNTPLMKEIRPMSERVVTHWNNDPFVYSQGSGYQEFEPGVYLFPYFLMKYNNLLR